MLLKLKQAFFIRLFVQMNILNLNAQSDAFITTWKTNMPGSSDSTSIEIPTIGAGYNYEVDWDNDGNYEQSGITGNITHDFGKSGIYTIRIRGDFPQIYFNDPVWEPIISDAPKLIDVFQWGSIVWHSFYKAFYGCVNLNCSATDLPDIRNVSNMSYAFAHSSFNRDIGNWNVRYVTNMSYMFYKSSFNQDIGKWNVSEVVNMEHMFEETPFNQDIGNWNVSKVTNMKNIFANSSFNQDLNSWDVSNVVSMSWMFHNSPFNHDIGNWNIKKVVDISFMFSRSLFNQKIEAWDVSNVKNMAYLFANTPFDQPIKNWNVSNVTQMEGIFSYTPFNQSIESWDVSNVSDMDHMFEGSLFNQSLSKWNVSNVNYMHGMFRNSKFNQHIDGWDVSNVVSMVSMFSGGSQFNQPIGNWNVSNVTNMQFMFYNSEFNQPIGNWDVSKVEYMLFMFGKSKFNQPINNWDVSNVKSFQSMFDESQFNKVLSNWTFRASDVLPMFLKSFLSNSAMDCANYSASIAGWANNPNNPDSLSIDVAGLKYGINVKDLRNDLINVKQWKFNGDSPSNTFCELTFSDDIQVEVESILIYPTPAKEEIVIKLQNTPKPELLFKIMDLTGRVVQIQAALIGRHTQKVSIESIASGMYILTATNNGNLIGAKKLIKE